MDKEIVDKVIKNKRLYWKGDPKLSKAIFRSIKEHYPELEATDGDCDDIHCLYCAGSRYLNEIDIDSPIGQLIIEHWEECKDLYVEKKWKESVKYMIVISHHGYNLVMRDVLYDTKEDAWFAGVTREDTASEYIGVIEEKFLEIVND